MATRRPFWKWHCWKSIGFFPYTQVICYWSLDLIFRAKLKLQSRNWKIQYGHQVAILKVTSLKINRLLANGHKQHAYEIWNWNSKANMSYSSETMSPTESRYQKIQDGHQAAIVKVTLLKINRLLPIDTSDVPVKLGLDIQRQSKASIQKLINPIWLPGNHFESDIAENK